MATPYPATTSLSSSWTPDESPQTLFAEKGWLQGVVVSSVAFGVVVTLFFMCFAVLYKQTATRAHSRQRIILWVYICVVFILNTLFIAANSQFTQLAFIDDRNYPGGPAQFENDMWSIPIDEVNNVVFVLQNWMNDGMIVWRAYVIFQAVGIIGYQALRATIVLPVLVFMLSIAFGTMWLIQTSAASPWTDGTENWTVPFFSVSLGLNLLVTLMIVSSLLFYRWKVNKVLGAGHGAQYLSLAAMLIESAALYATWALLFLIPFMMNNAISEVFLQALGQVQTISSFLIVFRVAQGKGCEAKRTQLLSISANMGTFPSSLRAKTSHVPLSALSAPTFTSTNQGYTGSSMNRVTVEVTREVEFKSDVETQDSGVGLKDY